MKKLVYSKAIKTLCLGIILGTSMNGIAQTAPPVTEKLIPYGDFNSWMVRIIDESFVIGGNTKILYDSGCRSVQQFPRIPLAYIQRDGKSQRCHEMQHLRVPGEKR